MYNGVGIPTPRGSGTSGYVQSNKFHIKPSKLEARQGYQQGPSRKGGRPPAPNKAILEHNRKREVENKVLEMRVRMEEEGYDEEEIQAAEAEERERLREERGTEEPAGAEHDTHREAAQKEAENERLAKALGVDPNQKTEEVFDRELQERKKEERLAQKLESMKQEERARRQKEREQIRDRGNEEEEGAGESDSGSSASEEEGSKKRKKRGKKAEHASRQERQEPSMPPPPPRDSLRPEEEGDGGSPRNVASDTPQVRSKVVLCGAFDEHSAS